MRSITLSYGRGMTRYAIDTEGVSRERLALAHDPAELHECASLVAAATAGALSALGVEGQGIRVALERFRAVPLTTERASLGLTSHSASRTAIGAARTDLSGQASGSPKWLAAVPCRSPFRLCD